LLADERRERERRELAAAVERFVDALHAGHVLPEDFTPLTRARAAANPRPTRRTPP
jgi:plasmid stabilization system protein ParE